MNHLFDRFQKAHERAMISWKKTPSSEFKRSLAIVIGIDCYSKGIPPLTTAVNDASKLARILETQHGYSVTLLTEDVTKSRIEAVFKEQKNNLSENDRLLFYFAGHGVASDCDKGPEGYLIPQDADQKDEKTFWKMTELHKALDELPCRHVLVILDCCFAGAFRWSSKRDFQPLPSVMYRERYERFIRSSAWQVVTSAAHNQKALDILSGREQGTTTGHSPFALSLFKALDKELLEKEKRLSSPADSQGDGVVTATELYIYLRDQVEVSAEQLASHQQTPGLWPLNNHRHGEFIFLVPGGKVDLPPAPDLTEKNNPYKGLSPYEADDSKLFFGRTALIRELQQKVEEQAFIVVLGASGTGKSSLVKAGLIPSLKSAAAEQNQESCWRILPVMRPDEVPLSTLRSVLVNELAAQDGGEPVELIKQWREKNPGTKLLLVLDQFEEVITMCRQEQARKDFIRELMQALEEHSEVLRLVLTLRSDFEAQISQTDLKKYWQEGNRFVVPPMTQNELREVIEQPASVMVLYFEPHELIDRLINEVIQTPGALPLLSFTLSELYLRYVARQKDIEQEEGDRALTEADYKEIGGVIGSLRRRIDQEYESLDDEHKATMRRILLRMVAFEGGGLTRRRVPRWELKYPDAAENERVDRVVAQLSQARLIVAGSSEKAGGGLEEDVEPAHDALIVAWDKLLQWQKDEAENMLLHRQLTRAAADWEDSAGAKDRDGLLWDSSPRLLRAQEILEQKWSRSRAVPTAGQISFRGLRQFWKVLFPTFKHLEQHIWLNRVETDFLRRSVEKKRNWTRRVSGFISAVVVVLAIAGVIAWIQKQNAISALEKANYNLSKAFEEKSSNALEIAAKEGTVSYKKAVLFAASSLREDAAKLNLHLSSNFYWSIFDYRTLSSALEEQWTSIKHLSGIYRVAFTKNSRYIVYIYQDNSVGVFDIVDKKETTIINSNFYKKIFIDHSGVFLAAVSDHNMIHLLNIETGNEISLKENINDVVDIVFSPDGKNLASTISGSGETGVTLQIWNTESGNTIDLLKNYKNNVLSTVFSPDGKNLASALRSSDGTGVTIQIWNAETGQKGTALKAHCGDKLSFSPDGKKLASASAGSDDTVIRVLNIETGGELATLYGHVGFLTSLSFSPDGKKLASASGDTTIRLWDTSTWQESALFSSYNNISDQTPAVLNGNASIVYDISFSHDNKKLASASNDGIVRIWDTESRKVNIITGEHDEYIENVSFIDDTDKISFSLNNETFRIFDMKSREEKNIDISAFSKTIISPNGKIMASVLSDNKIRLWNNDTGNEIKIIKGDNTSVNPLSFGIDNKKLFYSSSDNIIHLFDIETGKETASLKGHKDTVSKVSFSRYGKKLASSSYDSTIRFWDIETKKETMILNGHKEGVTSFSFSYDGKNLASSSFDKTVRLWDTETGKEIAILKGHDAAILDVSFSPDGKNLASASMDRTIRLWDIKSRKEIAMFKCLSGYVCYMLNVSFSPDGKKLASSSSDRRLHLWNLNHYFLFMQGSSPTPLYRTFIEAVKFLWQLDVQGMEIVHKERTPADMERFGSLLALPPPGQSKFDQVLEWAEKQQASNPTD